ncbi:hypothetical protein B1C78_02495 [Thioalkalivibrio denitrificans]|uniref:IrrE N-terminal-like domain-containing protein n=1 Tax=Thioalkalivibrio denitrificans TaxID=108003 RepID=A0A1V3NS42_9GAMM|nr:hypothetical protein B1C78_02495 [Thioalkalivibrio denitrificans]
MLSRSDLEQFAKVCTGIGNAAADGSGFVPIRNLLDRFQAKLVAHPMLVEGMLASVNPEHARRFGGDKWVVLLDSETYAFNEQDVQQESANDPLPSRLRNTVAHELVHSLAFRPSEFGMRLRGAAVGRKNGSDVVEAIEAETERFSPLLLCSAKSLKNYLSSFRRTLSVTDISKARRWFGVSREVMINRLRLLPPDDDSRNLPALRNFGIGIGTWKSQTEALLRSWPLFVNFDRNIVPRFLLELRNQDMLPASQIFSDPNFALSGGQRSTTTMEAESGTLRSGVIERIPISCSVEPTSRNSGSAFLIVVHKA